MPNIESLITGSDKLTKLYGRWPSFHDAEVVEVNLWRGQFKGGGWDPADLAPVLTVKICVLRTDRCEHHTLVTLRFTDVEEFRMEGFNHQNAIFDLIVNVEERGAGLTPYLLVEFHQSFGMGATFRCFGIEVMETVPCDERGTR